MFWFEQYFVDREKSKTLINCFRHERLYLVVGCGNTRKNVLNAVWSIHWSVDINTHWKGFCISSCPQSGSPGLWRFLHTLGNLELFCWTNHWFTVYNLRAILTVRGSLSGWFLAMKPSLDVQRLRRSRRNFPARSILSVWNKNEKGWEQVAVQVEYKWEKSWDNVEGWTGPIILWGGITNIEENSKHVRRRRRYDTQ